MSMPTFPPCATDISKDQAFSMLIGSIAMEHMALSHILNAESEKFCCIKRCHCCCALPEREQELIDLNKSVARVLDGVMHNQLLLKGQLEQVLDAKDSFCCPPPHKPPAHGCGTCRPAPVDCLCLNNANLIDWKCDCRFPWKGKCRSSGPAIWSENDPTTVYLCAGQRFLLSFYFELAHCGAPVRVALNTIQGGAVYPLQLFEGDGRMLDGSLVCPSQEQSVTPLFFTLQSPCHISVQRALWTIAPVG